MYMPETTPGGRVYRLFTALAERPHLLIAGATGSGKSVTVNGIIYSLLATRSPYQCRFVLLDPKKVELSIYRNLPHVARYASDMDDMVDALNAAVKEMDRRFSAMQREGVREYTGPDLYVIIDEFADLMIMRKNDVLPLLQRLAALGRAARIHLIACSQNVMAVTCPTTLKCNFPAIFGLRTATASQSRYLISSKGCETLPDPKRTGKGYGYLRDGADLDRYEIYRYPDDDIQRMIDYWTGKSRRSA